MGSTPGSDVEFKSLQVSLPFACVSCGYPIKRGSTKKGDDLMYYRSIKKYTYSRAAKGRLSFSWSVVDIVTVTNATGSKDIGQGRLARLQRRLERVIESKPVANFVDRGDSKVVRRQRSTRNSGWVDYLPSLLV